MLEILKETIIFNGLSLARIQEILEKIKYEKKKYKKGINIAFRGDKIDSLNIILKGSVSTEMLTKEGNVRKIETLIQTNILAAAFIFGNNNNFPVDLVSNEEVELLVIKKVDFLKILSIENKILENFLNEISNKTQLLSAKIWNSFNNKTIEEKLCDFIRNKQRAGKLTIDNLKDLAESFGVARPSLSRVLSDYVKEEKLERIGRNQYKIINRDFFEL